MSERQFGGQGTPQMRISEWGDSVACVEIGGRYTHLPAAERQAAAQALAGDEWRVVSAKQPGPPDLIDPADVKVGDVVEVSETGTVEKITNNTTGTRSFLLKHDGIVGSALVTSRTTVRLVRRAEPEPDPEQVEALWNLGHQLGAGRGEPLLSHGEAAELIRRGVTVRKET